MTLRPGGVLGLAAATAVIVLGLPAPGFSCSCVVSSGSPCAAANAAAAVFVGTPIAVQSKGQLHYRFAIEEPLRNAAIGIVEITTRESTAACGYPLEVGTKYLVYAGAGPQPGSYTVSYCTRTAPLDKARDDVELLRQQAAGAIRPRLYGYVDQTELLLEGDFSTLDGSGPYSPVRNLLIRATGPDGVHETRTDDNGRFVFDGVKPGRYDVTLQPPEGYELVFPEPLVGIVGECGGTVCSTVARMPFRGRLRPAEGEAIAGAIPVGVTEFGPDGRPSLGRTVLTWAEPDTGFSLAGLPPGKYALSIGALEAPTPAWPYVVWYPNAAGPEAATPIDLTGPKPVTVTFQLPPRIPEIRLSGIALDADGRRRANLWVELYDADVTVRNSVSRTVTDSDGRFSISGLRGRRYRIEAREKSYGGAASGMIDVSEDMARAGITLTLKPR